MSDEKNENPAEETVENVEAVLEEEISASEGDADAMSLSSQRCKRKLMSIMTNWFALTQKSKISSAATLRSLKKRTNMYSISSWVSF